MDTRKKVLIAGAGVAGLEAALALRALTGDRVAVELVAPGPDFVYRPLAVTAPFGVGETERFPLGPLAAEAGAELTEAAVRAVHPERMTVETFEGTELSYDALLLALGAVPVASVAGAVAFRGPGDEPALAEVLQDARAGNVRRLAFTMPAGISWPLPMYELALLTAVHLADAGAEVLIEVVTPEQQPLQLFGPTATASVAEQLDVHGIRLHTDTVPLAVEGNVFSFVGTGSIEVDRVVALPRIEGPRLAGVPHDSNGFVPTDAHARVRGLHDVYAAGDLTDFPIKQGGLAAQEADAAAEAIAASAGAGIVPRPFAPVLRGLMLTGLTPRFMETELGSLETQLDTEPLWWPPAKIAGRHLGPFLASHLHLAQTAP
ncbi:MAG TPA: FAD/NAD(P)-binding oxidoreductase [Gaiellaceae bacterium]|nr:FAD/NAD(P)-binding oxidoreductase [Gaiellaceae bacterium]